MTTTAPVWLCVRFGLLVNGASLGSHHGMWLERISRAAGVRRCGRWHGAAGPSPVGVERSLPDRGVCVDARVAQGRACGVLRHLHGVRERAAAAEMLGNHRTPKVGVRDAECVAVVHAPVVQAVGEHDHRPGGAVAAGYRARRCAAPRPVRFHQSSIRKTPRQTARPADARLRRNVERGPPTMRAGLEAGPMSSDTSVPDAWRRGLDDLSDTE